MAATLVLRLAHDPGVAAWQAVEADGRPGAAGSGPLADAAPLAAGRRVVALLPAGETLLARVAVPSRRPHHIRQAVPFLLEEQLATEVGALHFAAGTRAADGSVPVVAVARERLQQRLDALAAAGLAPVAVYAELLALPAPEPGQWTLAGDENALLLRSGSCSGMALDGGDGVELLGTVLAAADPPVTRLACHGAAARAAAAALPEALRPEPVDTDPVPLLQQLGQAAAGGAAAPNLLQGEFARDAGRRARWQAWRLPAALAASLLLLLLGVRAWEIQRLEGELSALRGAQEAVLKEAFPEIQRVVDPVVQLRQRLETLRGGSGSPRFLELLAAAGTTLGEQQGWEISGLSYRDEALQLQLQLPAFEQFDRLRERFAGVPGLVAEIGSLGSVENQVRGSLTLRRSGS